MKNGLRDADCPFWKSHPVNEWVIKDKHCKGCYYYRCMCSEIYCCAYIFVEDKRRPCPPGKDCTVKIRRKDRNRGTEDGK